MYCTRIHKVLVGLLFAGYGLWLLWRGIRNDIGRDLYGDPMVPRWMYIAGGTVIVVLSLAYVAFLLSAVSLS